MIQDRPSGAVFFQLTFVQFFVAQSDLLMGVRQTISAPRDA